MCEFCEKIACDDKQFGEFRLSGKEEFIFKDEEKRTFGICVESGDSFMPGIFKNISYCPRCGRKLEE